MVSSQSNPGIDGMALRTSPRRLTLPPFRSGKWRVNLPIPDLLLFLGPPPIAFRPPVRSICSISHCVNVQRQVPRSRHFGNWLRPKIPLLGPPLSLLYSHIAAAVAFRQSRTRQQKLVLQTLINGILSKWVTRVAASCGDHASGRNYEYMGSAVASGARDWRNLLL